MPEGLQKRIVTAIVLVAVLLVVVLWLPAVATVVALTAVILAGAWEWSAFLRAPGNIVRWVYVAIVAALLPIAWQVSATAAGRNAILLIAAAWWLVALVWIVFAPRRASSGAAAAAGIFALVPAWVALLRLRLDLVRGAEWMLFALLLVWAADIGAFFFGRRYGKHRLAPHVSPGKTWEGVFGGFAASALVAAAGSAWFTIPLARFLPLCLTVVAFSIIGDLTESLLKRFAGMKDSGTLFPGHGGVMDRLDSVTGAAPILLFGLTALGVAA